LQAALKRGIEMTFQIEESELVAEPLPKQDERQALLFYEAAEGGAGVLTRLATEPQAMAQVAAAALRVMHYRDPAGPGRWMICPHWSTKPRRAQHLRSRLLPVPVVVFQPA
jgi:aminoglycoside phosphotransferase